MRELFVSQKGTGIRPARGCASSRRARASGTASHTCQATGSRQSDVHSPWERVYSIEFDIELLAQPLHPLL